MSGSFRILASNTTATFLKTAADGESGLTDICLASYSPEAILCFHTSVRIDL